MIEVPEQFILVVNYELINYLLPKPESAKSRVCQSEILPEQNSAITRVCQSQSAKYSLQKTVCQIQSAKYCLPNTVCQSQSAKASVPNPESARDSLPAKASVC